MHRSKHKSTRRSRLSRWIPLRQASLMWFGVMDGVTAGALLTGVHSAAPGREYFRAFAAWCAVLGHILLRPWEVESNIHNTLWERREALKIQQAATKKSKRHRRGWRWRDECVCVLFLGGGFIDKIAIGFLLVHMHSCLCLCVDGSSKFLLGGILIIQRP